MPLATLHLLALAPSTTVYSYLDALQKANIEPLVRSRPVRWIIRPEQLSVSPLLSTTWDLLLILPASTPIPPAYTSKAYVRSHWSITAGVPSSLIQDFSTKNNAFLHPALGSVPELTGSLTNPRKASSTQGLELNDELHAWSRTFHLGQTGAVSMLNLLKFTSAPDAHKNYQTYGKAFAESVGSRRGGVAKIVGKVVPKEGDDAEGWDEVALAHYPSIRHFVDMLASEDYQAVNHEFRLPSLKDTCILCTTELDPILEGGQEGRARL